MTPASAADVVVEVPGIKEGSATCGPTQPAAAEQHHRQPITARDCGSPSGLLTPSMECMQNFETPALTSQNLPHMTGNSSSGLEQPGGLQAVPSAFIQTNSDAKQGLASGPRQTSTSAAQWRPSQEGHAESHLAGKASNDRGNVWQLLEGAAGQMLPGRYELPKHGNRIPPSGLISAGKRRVSPLHATPLIEF